jgi:hypothetical protein
LGRGESRAGVGGGRYALLFGPPASVRTSSPMSKGIGAVRARRTKRSIAGGWFFFCGGFAGAPGRARVEVVFLCFDRPRRYSRRSVSVRRVPRRHCPHHAHSCVVRAQVGWSAWWGGAAGRDGRGSHHVWGPVFLFASVTRFFLFFFFFFRSLFFFGPSRCAVCPRRSRIDLFNRVFLSIRPVLLWLGCFFRVSRRSRIRQSRDGVIDVDENPSWQVICD